MSTRSHHVDGLWGVSLRNIFGVLRSIAHAGLKISTIHLVTSSIYWMPGGIHRVVVAGLLTAGVAAASRSHYLSDRKAWIRRNLPGMGIPDRSGLLWWSSPRKICRVMLRRRILRELMDKCQALRCRESASADTAARCHSKKVHGPCYARQHKVCPKQHICRTAPPGQRQQEQAVTSPWQTIVNLHWQSLPPSSTQMSTGIGAYNQ